jgi:hypothetical protein
MVATLEESDFQILAHFAKRSAGGISTHVGGRATELASESVGEVAVAGKPQLEGECSQIVCAIGQSFERGTEAKPGQIAMKRQAGLFLKEAGEMKRGCVDGARDILERDALAQLAREVRFGRLGTVSVIGVRAGSPAPARLTVPRERGFQNVGDELKRRHVGPERFERFRLGCLQPLHEFAVPPENTGVARACSKGKRSFRVFVNRRVEFADNIVEHARRRDENSAAIAAIGRMADPIARSL